MFREIVFTALFLLCLNLALAGADAAPGETINSQKSFSKLPLLFVENQGQIDSKEVAYYVKGADKTLYFTPEGITFVFSEKKGDAIEQWTTKLKFVNVNPVRPKGEEKQSTVFSYFRGKREDWHTDLPAYGRVVYSDLWPGIDLVYSGSAQTLKYEYRVAPGVDPSQIRLTYEGVTDLTVEDTGELAVSVPLGGFLDGHPVAWQVIDGEKKSVSLEYSLEENTDSGKGQYSFEIGSYDTTEPLVLDPVLLVYCGYIGGSDADEIFSVKIDDQKRAYVTGMTRSDQLTFPVQTGPSKFYSGWADGFVARVNATGSALEYCGYIGGADFDEADGCIAVDSQGRAYITGTTVSDESSFPVTIGPDLTYNGSQDVFVARVKENGTDLEYCGYIGGINDDNGYGIAVNDQGNAYVTGYAKSDENTFPVLGGPDITHNSPYMQDVFVACVKADGTALEYCGYIGGDGDDEAYAIALDAQDAAYVVGETESNEATFPVSIGPDLKYNFNQDAFIAKVKPGGNGLEFCGYIGGEKYDTSNCVALDDLGNIYVTGTTASNESTFPVFIGPDLTYNGGVADGYVARVKPSGTGLDYCGYIGGNKADWASGIAVDGHANAYVVGTTTSFEGTFPVLIGPDLTKNIGKDSFVARVKADGNGLVFCGYIGGHGNDEGFGIVVDDDGDAYVAGITSSYHTSFPVTVGPDLTHNGVNDGYVAKISSFQFTLTATPDPLVPGQSATFSVTGATPNKPAWLGYSVKGLGAYHLWPLNIWIDIRSPKKLAGPTTTNGQGALDWTLQIPQFSGLRLWIQAVQDGKISNVVITKIL